MSWQGWFLFLLICASFFVHFFDLSWPAQVVFDEYYFGKFASAYLTKTPYFDIHPPTGKLMLGAATWLFQINPVCKFEAVGHPCDPHIFLALRFFPALFGSLLVIVFYAFIKELTKSKNIALIGAFLLVFENAILSQARHIFIDIFLLFFGVLSLWLFLKALKIKENKKQWFFFALSAIALGLCFSVKWTGLGFAGIIFFLGILNVAESKISPAKLFKIGAITASIVCAIYLLSFWIHFQLIPAGGDVDLYLGENFQGLNFIEKIIKINSIMLLSNENIPAGHPSESRFYAWPFMHKIINYGSYGSHGEPEFKQISLTGNSVIWYLSTFSILLLMIGLFSKQARKEFFISPFLTFFITTSYFLNLLPFVLIARSTFLYHYFPSYLFAIIALAFLLNWIRKRNKTAFIIMLIIILAGFVAMLPTTYGFPAYF
jgi:dolichyl-phosphate-mannose-protein mannosyltransferase